MSEKKYGRGKKATYTYEEVRPLFEAAIMDRGRYLGFFYKVMPRDLFDRYARQAMWEYGANRVNLRDFPPGKGKVESLTDFFLSEACCNVACTSDGDHYAVELGPDRGVIHFAGKCCLAEAWKGMGFAPDEVAYLCDVTCQGDYGHADALDLKCRFNYTCAQQGHDECEVVVEKK